MICDVCGRNRGDVEEAFGLIVCPECQNDPSDEQAVEIVALMGC